MVDGRPSHGAVGDRHGRGEALQDLLLLPVLLCAPIGGRAASACPAGQGGDAQGPGPDLPGPDLPGPDHWGGSGQPADVSSTAGPDGRLHGDAVHCAPRPCPPGTRAPLFLRRALGTQVPSPRLRVRGLPDLAAHVSEAEQASVPAGCEGGPAGLTQPGGNGKDQAPRQESALSAV